VLSNYSSRQPEVIMTATQSMSNQDQRRQARAAADTARAHYKWMVLSNTTLGVLMATINASILLIALPDIFRGIERSTRSHRATPATCCG
jgi:hypothetical protein